MKPHKVQVAFLSIAIFDPGVLSCSKRGCRASEDPTNSKP